MAGPSGSISNQFDEIIDELSNWNDILKETSLGQKPAQP